MSRPRFLADEDLRFEIVLAVRRMEPSLDIATVYELGRAGSTDAEVLEFAHANGFLLIPSSFPSSAWECHSWKLCFAGSEFDEGTRPVNSVIDGGGRIGGCPGETSAWRVGSGI